MWKGMSRLIDIESGLRIAMKIQEKQIDKLNYAESTIRKEAKPRIKECKSFKLLVSLFKNCG